MKKIYNVAWTECREVLNDVKAGTPQECLEAVEEIIDELESMAEGLRSDIKED